MKPHPKLRSVAKRGGFALALVFASLWIMNWSRDAFWKDSSGYGAQAYRGRIVVFHDDVEPRRFMRYAVLRKSNGDSLQWNFEWHRAKDYWNVHIPIWQLMVTSLLFTVPACVWMIRAQWRRHRRGLFCRCWKCGYQMRGLTTSVCPECGSGEKDRKTRFHVRAIIGRETRNLPILFASGLFPAINLVLNRLLVVSSTSLLVMGLLGLLLLYVWARVSKCIWSPLTFVLVAFSGLASAGSLVMFVSESALNGW